MKKPIVFILLSALVLLSGCSAGNEASSPAGETREILPRDVTGDLLLVVDFQNVYMPGNEWACPSMPAAMANTMKIMDAPNAPDCVMTRFVAPAEPAGRWVDYNEAYRDINENAFLSEIPEEFAPYAQRAVVIDKSTYSSLDAPEVRATAEGKKAVVLAGVVADCCVIATMYDAIDMGYEVVYLYDCIGGSSPESEEEIRALAEVFSPVHTTVMSAEEYLAAFGNDLPFRVNSGVDGSLSAARADGLDFGKRIRQLHQALRAREEVRQEIGSETEAQHRQVVFVHQGSQFIDLFRCKKLRFISDDYIMAPRRPVSLQDALLRGDHLRFAGKADPAADEIRSVPGVGAWLNQPNCHTQFLIVEFGNQRLCRLG